MANVEEIKKHSHGLRGSLPEALASDTRRFGEEDRQILKFHGIYQQDDRDLRMKRIRAKQEAAWILMVRCKIPGGGLTAEQFLALDRLAAELGNGALRVTSRQDLQFHGVLKSNVRELVRQINAAKVTTFGGCGDVERNVVASPAPFDTPAHREVQRVAREISSAFLPRTRAYFDVWLNGEKVDLPSEPEAPDPVYGQAYLPRKFKTALVVPPDNDVDIHASDLGFIAHCPGGSIEGYTVLAGGSFGMDHGKRETFPFLAVPLFYVSKEYVVPVVKAVISIHRDYGDRANRRHARVKYIIADRGLDWFREEAKRRLGVPVEAPKPFAFRSVADKLGWHKQGDSEGWLFCGIRLEYGRIRDDPATRIRWRSGLRAVLERFRCPIRLTPNQNLLCCNVEPGARPAFDALLKEYGIPAAETYTEARRMSIACVALPTCGLALSEGERVFTPLMEKLDAVLKELNLENEPILFRMTGCPNGCARTYNADFGFVGRGIGKYAVYVGGSHRGDRMAGLAFRSVELERIPEAIRPILEEYASHKRPGETFTDYWGRTHRNGPAPHPDQFHEILA